MLRACGVAAFAMFVTFVGGCSGGAPPKAKLTNAPKDVYGQIAARAAESPCGDAANGPQPAAPSEARGDDDFATDVVFYLAHPEDETLFTPGTMDALARADKRVFAVFLSHGEGGRLLERGPDGHIKERTGVPPEQVAEVRDREIAHAMKTLGIAYDRLYPASARADFPAEDVAGTGRATHACSGTYERWDALLPGGLAGLVKKLVEDIRTRRPRVVVTHDPRDDDDEILDHGHHKALGALVDIAARAAADENVPGGTPHVVEEVVSVAPTQLPADVTLEVGNSVRKKLMTEHASQFELPKFAALGQRTSERFVVRWRARGAKAPPGGSLLVPWTQTK